MLKNFSNSEMSNLIDEWIHNERDRKILKRRLIDGVIYEKIAEEFNLSVVHIKNIVHKSKNELIKHF